MRTAVDLDAVGAWDPRSGTFAVSKEQADSETAQLIAAIHERHRRQKQAAEGAVAAGRVQVLRSRRGFHVMLAGLLGRRA